MDESLLLNIDKLVKSEKAALRMYIYWTISIIVTGILLFVFTNSYINDNKIPDLGNNFVSSFFPQISSAMILFFTKFPITEILARKRNIDAFNIIKDMAVNNDPEAKNLFLDYLKK